MKRVALSLILTAAFAASGGAQAHHSHSMFSMDKELTLEGRIKRIEWANPHVWLYIDVPASATAPARTWGFEGTSPLQLKQKGWSKADFKVGDRIKINCWPLRSGAPGCLGGYVLQINGKTLPPTHNRHAGREFD